MLYFEDFVAGDTVQAGSITVSQDDIIAYASRYDAQDFHTDPEAAKSSFVGTLIASGWHSCSLLMRLLAESFISGSSGMGAPGIDEVRWLPPGFARRHDQRATHGAGEQALALAAGDGAGALPFRPDRTRSGETVVEQTNWIMFGRRGMSQGQPKGDWLAHSPHYVPPTVMSPLEAPSDEAEPSRFFEELDVGSRHELGSLVFTPDEIIAFARSFDPQPFHLSDEAARNSPFGRLAASGWHTGSGWMAAMVSHRKRGLAACGDNRAPRLGPSPGFKNLRWSKPVFAGDRITYFSEVTDKRASASRPEWGLFFHRNTGVNQHGEEVFSFEGCVFVERLKPASA